MRLTRYYDCADCGKPTIRVRASQQPLVCEDCSITRLETNARQIHDRSGPGYDKWRSRMAQWADNVRQHQEE